MEILARNPQVTPHGAAAGKGGVATCVALSVCEQVRATCKGCSTNYQQCSKANGAGSARLLVATAGINQSKRG